MKVPKKSLSMFLYNLAIYQPTSTLCPERTCRVQMAKQSNRLKKILSGFLINCLNQLVKFQIN